MEDSPKEIEDNTPEEGDIVLPTTAQMADIKMWVHHTPGILLCNRTSHREPEVPEGEDIDPEELLKRIEAADPYERRLKPINEDREVLISKNLKTKPWTVR